jgi:glycogen(starch) synthase
MSGGPTHVFMTTDAVGGVWTYARDLAGGLAARGVRVTLANLGPRPSAAQTQDVTSLQGVELVEADAALDWLEEAPERLEWGSRELARLAAEARVDVVHLNSPAYATADFVAPVVGVCHSCLLSWWEAVRGGQPPGEFAAAGERLRRGYSACDALVAPTEAFATITQRLYGVRPVVVPNGRAAARRGSAGVKEPFVLTSGRLWDEGKNVAALDAAAALMRGRVEAAGPLEGPAGQRVVLRAALSLGRLEAGAMADRLDSAAVYASLAVYEPFGLGVLEAAQAGCALVLSDIPTFRELWDGAAVFVNSGDQSGVAQTLDALLEDPRERARLGALASVRAGSLSAAAMVARMLAVHREVLARRTLRGCAA